PPSLLSHTLSLHDALPILSVFSVSVAVFCASTVAVEPSPRIIAETAREARAIAAAGTVSLGTVSFGMLKPVRDVGAGSSASTVRSEEHTSELQSRENLVCR